MKYLTKPGKFGVLYRYAIPYNDTPPIEHPDFEWRTWAYSAEHAAIKFDDSNEDLGFVRTGEPRRVLDPNLPSP